MGSSIATPTDTVTELLGADHRKLDALLAEAKRELAGGAVRGGATGFAVFRRGLDRHIAVEEELLFPVLESHTGASSAGPTRVMRAEHRHILQVMDEIGWTLEREDAPDCLASLAALTGLLSAHNGKEERILYPMIDHALTDEPERPEILRRIRALRT